MQFVNYQEMSRTLLSNRSKLPRSIDLIVGIPRSGMLPATMLASQLNLPLTDVDGLIEDKIFGYGSTKKAPDLDKARSSDRVVLVIDDTVGSGRAFKQAKQDLAGIRGRFIYCAVFAQVVKHPDVDIVLDAVTLSPICQWNMMHHDVLRRSCVDIDGVLCRNPEAHEDDNGKAYQRFLSEAEPLHATSGEIGWLVTGRRSIYRPQTEAWLEQHGVTYRQLIMAETKDEHENSSRFKARIYQETGAELFIESEALEAEEIFESTHKPVLCVATQEMILDSKKYRAVQKKAANGSFRTRLAKLKLQLRSMTGDKLYYTLKGLAGRE